MTERLRQGLGCLSLALLYFATMPSNPFTDTTVTLSSFTDASILICVGVTRWAFSFSPVNGRWAYASSDIFTALHRLKMKRIYTPAVAAEMVKCQS
jgi:hypothetical protein